MPLFSGRKAKATVEKRKQDEVHEEVISLTSMEGGDNYGSDTIPMVKWERRQETGRKIQGDSFSSRALGQKLERVKTAVKGGVFQRKKYKNSNKKKPFVRKGKRFY